MPLRNDVQQSQCVLLLGMQRLQNTEPAAVSGGKHLEDVDPLLEPKPARLAHDLALQVVQPCLAV